MSLKRAFKTLHLALDGPFIFCSTIHHYKRDHLHMVAKSLSHQHSPDRGTGSGTRVPRNTCPLWIQETRGAGLLGNSAREANLPITKDCSKADRKVMNISYCRHEAAQRSRWVKRRICKTNKGKLACHAEEGKSRITKKAESTLYMSTYHFTN